MTKKDLNEAVKIYGPEFETSGAEGVTAAMTEDGRSPEEITEVLEVLQKPKVKLNKAELMKKAANLGIVIDEHRTTPDQLQTIIENVENGIENHYFRDDVFTGDSKNEIFQEVRVLREPHSKKGNTLVTPFTIVDIVRKRVLISAREVAAINHGRREEAGNKVFTLFLRPGTKKVDDLIQENGK